jgi:hypothetical protein
MAFGSGTPAPILVTALYTACHTCRACARVDAPACEWVRVPWGTALLLVQRIQHVTVCAHVRAHGLGGSPACSHRAASRTRTCASCRFVPYGAPL